LEVQARKRGKEVIAGSGTQHYTSFEGRRRSGKRLWEKVEETKRKKKKKKKEWRRKGSRKTDRCQGNEGNLHFVKLSLGSSRARPEHGG